MRLGRDGRIVAACVAFVAVMVGAAYASVPLYDLFCRMTGFAGTPAIASAEVVPGLVPVDRTVTVRFDANVSGGLPWRFKPDQRTMTVRVGEVASASYTIENVTSRATVGQASYNVTTQAGGYFTKIDCFCFTAQPLGPGETRDVPVVFYIDPAFAEDRNATGVNTLTLSYTFFPLPGTDAGTVVGTGTGTGNGTGG